MKRSLLFFLLSLLAFLPATAGPRDSLYLHMVELAMEGNLRALRPLYAQYRDSLPPMYRLACDLTVADDDCDDARFVECIDSLDHFYSHHIPAANRAVWAVQKAAALCRLGRYPDAAAYCERELKRLDHAPQPSVQAEQLAYYRDKGLRYADTLSVRGRILGLTDRSDIEGLLRLCALLLFDPYGQRLYASADDHRILFAGGGKSLVYGKFFNRFYLAVRKTCARGVQARGNGTAERLASGSTFGWRELVLRTAFNFAFRRELWNINIIKIFIVYLAALRIIGRIYGIF